MRRLALALLMSSAAAPVLAAEARVRSGEHGEFARLVLYLPEPTEYAVEAEGRSFAIDFEADFGFDASKVFYYIPRTRIADLATGPGRLSLELACDCVVTVRRLSDRAVYLDVNDPGTVEALPAAAAVEEAAPEPLTPQVRLPLLAPESVATLLPGGLDVARPELAEARPEEKPPARASDTTRAIAEQLARATAQGLLDPKSPLPEDPASAPPPEPEPAAPSAGESPRREEEGTRRHVSIRSSVDEALGDEVAAALDELGLTGPCLDDASFDVAGWAPGGWASVVRARAATIGEFDRPDPAAIRDLARAYIALGFGAEARHTIESFGVPVPEAEILLPMADVVDDGVSRDAAALEEEYTCPGASALWAALGSAQIPDAAELDTDAVTLAFSALPPQLRTRLGPKLAERLIAYGALDAARVVRTATVRAPGAPTVETELLDAKIAAATGRDAEADGKLAQVVEQTAGRSVEAVERLIERRLAAGEPVEDELLAAADALIFEHRGTPLAERLTELRIEGLATSGQARRALAFLAETEEDLPPATVERLRGVSYAAAARLADGSDFLLVAVNAARELGRSPEEMAARRAVASRLSEMQLYALAEGLGVEEARATRADAATSAPASPGVPAFEPARPADGAPLARTAALIEQSQALRQRLATVLEGGAAPDAAR